MSAADVEVAFGPLEKFTTRKVQKLILDAVANLTEDTPVDTGHAANNWIPSLDQPVLTEAGTRQSPSGEAQSAGIAEIAGYSLPRIGYIANNVPYIQSLNEGHSQQAPSGFVEGAVLKAVRMAAESGS